MLQVFHIFILIVAVDGEIVSEDMSFYSIDRCRYFAGRLNSQRLSPSLGPNVTAYCVPQLHNPEEDPARKIYT